MRGVEHWVVPSVPVRRVRTICLALLVGRVRTICLALLVAALTGGGLASMARADGDPASDYLLSRQVFLTSQPSSASSSQRQLVASVAAANRAGFGIRVAVISSAYDLGSITALWRRPLVYARFLGEELSLVYKQRLLVVMPNGFGFFWDGHSAGSADRLLARLPIEPGGAGLARAAQTAVGGLAAAEGVRLAAPAGDRGGRHTAARHAAVRHGSDDRIVLVAVLAALGLAAALLLTLRRGRARPAHALVRPRALPIRLPSRVSGIVIVGGLVAVAVLVALSRLLNPGAPSNPSLASVVTRPPFSWPAGQRPAPDFVLRDQSGRRVSLSAYRGRPVILTFVDPLCRNLCPLEAHLLNQVVGQLPAAQRPAILAVSVDVYADKRSDLLQDFSKWELVPQWHWAVGRKAQLAAVWKRYQIGVSVVTKRIAGTTINYITHTEAAYLIDASGDERALFLWPFYPADVVSELHKIT